jgi:hypothetical protein
MPDRPHKVLLLTYDCEELDEERYAALCKNLSESESTGWWHHLPSTWLVCTGETPEELYGRIKPFLGKDDSVFIIEVAPNYFGWLPDRAWKWIEHHVDRRDHPQEHAKRRRRAGARS